MKMLAAAFATALVLGAGTPALARAQAPAAATSVNTDTAAEVQAYIGRLATWAQPFHQSVAEQTDALVEIIGALETATSHYQGDHKAGQAWARQWAKAQKQRWDDIQKRFDAVSGVPLPAAPFPEVAALTEKMGALPSIMGVHLAQNRVLADRMAVQISAMAGGDQKAAEALPAEVMDISVALLEGENQMLAAGMPMVPQGHPQRELMAAGRHANLAVIALLQAQKANLLGAPLDEADLAARLRQHADALELSADSVEKSAQRTLANTRGAPGMAGTPLLAAIERAFATYPQSAAIERSFTTALRELATRIDAPGEVDFDTLADTADKLGTLVEERVAVDTQRRQLLQG